MKGDSHQSHPDESADAWLFNHHGQLHFYRGRPKTHIAAAGLITNLAHQRRRSGSGMSRRLKLSFHSERARENQQILTAHLRFFGLWIGHALDVQKSRRPSQLQRDDELIFGLVAVHVETRLHHNLQRLRSARSTFNRDRVRRPNANFILLGQAKRRERQKQREAECWSACPREDFPLP